jgi:hypothetical protein
MGIRQGRRLQRAKMPGLLAFINARLGFFPRRNSSSNTMIHTQRIAGSWLAIAPRTTQG